MMRVCSERECSYDTTYGSSRCYMHTKLRAGLFDTGPKKGLGRAGAASREELITAAKAAALAEAREGMVNL